MSSGSIGGAFEFSDGLCLFSEVMFSSRGVELGCIFVWWDSLSIREGCIFWFSLISPLSRRELDFLIILLFLICTKFLRLEIVFSTSPKLWAAPESDKSNDGIRPDSWITSKRCLAISSDELLTKGLAET